MNGTTDDPDDPRLTHGVDHEPRPQAEVYLVLPEADRAKGYVRPFRDQYKHVRGPHACNGLTVMSNELAATYARDPKFYGATYCTKCGMHRPVWEFNWIEFDRTEGPQVGT